MGLGVSGSCFGEMAELERWKSTCVGEGRE